MEKGRAASDVGMKKAFDLDELLEPLGGFGKYQLINILQVTAVIVLASITELSYVFTAGELKHRCLIAECETEDSKYDTPWISNAIPKTSDGYDLCRRYNYTGENGLCSNSTFSQESYQCNQFVYDTEEWTIAREDWNIQCASDHWMLTTIGSFNNGGVVLGSLFVGFLCDRFGRKAVIVSMSLIVAILGTIKSFSVNYAMFATFEFMEATMEGGLYTLPFVLALEIVEPSKRVFAGSAVACAYSLGEVLVGGIHWLTLDWRTTLRIVRLPFLALIILYWTLPESVRWLINKKRPDDAIKVLEKIAKTNGTILTDSAVKSVIKFSESGETEDAGSSRAEFFNLFRSRRMRLRFVATMFVWTANSFIFFGMNLNSVSINDNKFLNSILTSLIEIPAYLSVIFLLSRLGRRLTQSGSLYLCTVACLLFAFVPEWYWAQLLLFLLGKFGIAISFITIDIYTTEMFPTAIRASTISTSHMIGRIAAVLAPQTPLLETFYSKLPLLLFCAFAAIGGTLALTLPETLNTDLPETMEEAKNLGRKSDENKNKVLSKK